MNQFKNLVFSVDNLFITLSNIFFKNNKGIIFLLFHSVFKNQKELEYNHIDSQWGFNPVTAIFGVLSNLLIKKWLIILTFLTIILVEIFFATFFKGI